MPQISVGQMRHIDHRAKLLGGELIFVEYEFVESAYPKKKELWKVTERRREMEIKCYAILVLSKKDLAPVCCGSQGRKLWKDV